MKKLLDVAFLIFSINFVISPIIAWIFGISIFLILVNIFIYIFLLVAIHLDYKKLKKEIYKKELKERRV